MPSWARQKFENHGFSIAKNEVPGYSVVFKNGLNNDIDQSESATVWTLALVAVLTSMSMMGRQCICPERATVPT